MANYQKLIISVFIQVLVASLILKLADAQGLKLGFYKKTCPAAETIIKRTTAQFISRAPTLAAPLLRMHFHDCFVRGCDGSILLNSTKSNQAEKDAIPNQSLRGFQVIDAVKSAVETKCPGVVSCADIVALVARDAISMLQGPTPFWNVPLGRRDGKVSILTDALSNIPSFAFNFSQLQSSFASKGLSVKDLVVLSGAHTVGTSHCSSFTNRLYNFNGNGGADPTLDPNYVVQLKKKCKATDVTTLVEMDPGSFLTFDDDYYNLVNKRRGLFQSDAALLDNSATKSYVKRQVSSRGSSFFSDFEASMVKMGQIGVLTGSAGEIRKRCAFVN